MGAQHNHVFFPSALSDLFSIWDRFPDALPCAGGTGFVLEHGSRVPVFPRNIISLQKMDELKKISRTERYLEIGAMVKLNQIINMGKIVPEPLSRCLKRIAGPQVRNQATIGGNICFPLRRLDASVPMIALDAQYELRTAESTRWVSASRLPYLPGQPMLTNHELLTRIRVPLDPWTFTWYRKFRNSDSNESGGGILFIMKNEKNILTNIRIVYSGKSILREKKSETILLGKRLPLSQKDAEAFIDCWLSYLAALDSDEFYLFPGKDRETQTELTKTRIMNFIRTMIRHISD